MPYRALPHIMSQDDAPDKVASKILDKFAPAAKEIISEIKSDRVDQSSLASEEDIQSLKTYLKGIKPPAEITFQKIHEETGVDIKRMTNGLLKLITDGSVIGFINDKSTPDPSDDILILRQEHVVIDEEDI